MAVPPQGLNETARQAVQPPGVAAVPTTKSPVPPEGLATPATEDTLGNELRADSPDPALTVPAPGLAAVPTANTASVLGAGSVADRPSAEEDEVA